MKVVKTQTDNKCTTGASDGKIFLSESWHFPSVALSTEACSMLLEFPEIPLDFLSIVIQTAKELSTNGLQYWIKHLLFSEAQSGYLSTAKQDDNTFGSVRLPICHVCIHSPVWNVNSPCCLVGPSMDLWAWLLVIRDHSECMTLRGGGGFDPDGPPQVRSIPPPPSHKFWVVPKKILTNTNSSEQGAPDGECT